MLTASLLLSMGMACAGDKGGSFEERKQHVLSEITEHEKHLAEHKNCVQAAATQDALHECRVDMKEHRKAEKMERMQRRRDRLDQKIKEEKGS